MTYEFFIQATTTLIKFAHTNDPTHAEIIRKSSIGVLGERLSICIDKGNLNPTKPI